MKKEAILTWDVAVLDVEQPKLVRGSRGLAAPPFHPGYHLDPQDIVSSHIHKDAQSSPTIQSRFDRHRSFIFSRHGRIQPAKG
jgi:hypothetical protein